MVGNVTSEFLREIESHTMIISDGVTRCFGITKDPESNNFMMVIEYAEEGLCQPANVKPSQNEYEKQVYGVLPYVAPEVLRGKEYTQENNLYDKLLDDSDDSEIKKQVEEAERINEKITSTSLPYNEPKNAIDNKDDNNSIGEYSESIEAIDFTKLNLDKDN
ncbi:kinase-like domain-containing protein [Rhizophagus irregularis DAOM 181602=DAOM 197198]|nr:kinase-like domain-containing protein [Rhizophagus irregularis DAOM 181602=DAOM 197198]